MARRCQLTGKNRNVANKVSHANNKTKTEQQPNLQSKRLWLESQKRFVRVRLSTRALRTVSRLGLDRFLAKNNLSVSDLGR
jgi:large subunit ribosomal protein L28